jgi:hypothetical protein
MSSKVPVKPINLISPAPASEPSKESKLKMLADAVQMYLNGDYSKIIGQDEDNSEQPTRFLNEDHNIGQMILSTIE